MRRSFSLVGMLVACATAAAVSCSVDDKGEGNLVGDAGASGHGNNGSGGIVIGSGGSGNGSAGDSTSFAGNGSGGACATTNAATSLAPVRMAILFDASGSMGELDYPWHDPELKWNPVVAATEAFFADSESAGIEASLTFFPRGGQDERCDVNQYDEPDIPFTNLPSDVFANAIDEVTPDRGGTPTLAVLTATIADLEVMAEAEPNATYVILLVSDGYPQGCGDDDSMERVTAVVSAASDTFPTYVIGVRNPPIEDAPDNVTNLHQIAEAGGTEAAFLIDTGDPEQTTADFLEAVNGIRGEALSCELPIPDPPEGRELDAQRVQVTYTSGSDDQLLTYDPDCDGDNRWHYDDPDNPTQIELCEDTCDTMQADPDAELDVQFACEVLIPELY